MPPVPEYPSGLPGGGRCFAKACEKLDAARTAYNEAAPADPPVPRRAAVTEGLHSLALGGLNMWNYDKILEFPVNIKRPNAKAAQIIISQYGGPDGELGASLRYLSQKICHAQPPGRRSPQ